MRRKHGGAATPLMCAGDCPRAVAKAVGERLLLPVGAKGWEGTPELAGSDPKLPTEFPGALHLLCVPFVTCDTVCASCRNTCEASCQGDTGAARGVGVAAGGCVLPRDLGTEQSCGDAACPTATAAAAAAAADPASEINFCVRSPSSPRENRERNETLMSLNTSKGKL